MPKHKTEKAKDFKGSLVKLMKYSKKYFPLIFCAIFLAVAGTVLIILGPNYLSDLTNHITNNMMIGIDFEFVLKIGLILVSFYSAGFLFNYLQNYITVVVSNKLSKELRQDISKKMNNIPFKYYDKTTYGEILSTIVNDVDTLGYTISNSVVTIISSSALLIGSLVMMFITNWIMAFIAIAATLVGFVIMAVIMAKSQKYFNAQQNSLAELNGHIEEIYSGHDIVKVSNANDETIKSFGKINKKLYVNAWKSQFFSGLMGPLMGFIGNFGYVAVCISGALLVMNGTIGIGSIVSFMIYIRLFTQPLSQIAQAFTNIQSGAAASERVFSFLEEQELSDESSKTLVLEPSQVKGNIEFKNVKFGYDENKIIIPDFSAKVKAGQKIAIVGPTGAGKTTLVNLLMRFYELNDGQITIDGIPSSDLTRENIHDLFGMVLQDTWLFEGTIKENLVFNKENVSDEEIVKACEACGVDHFIRTLPNGYDMVLDDNTAISAGQKQLMTIARAMIQNAPMLILDEATSSVDTRTEELIQKAMDKLTKNRTSFVIAHRLSTIKNADLILVMKDGNIIEKGKHKQLLAANGFYADLYNSQFSSKYTEETA
mgnify:FL=1